jgi:hypothetical protein
MTDPYGRVNRIEAGSTQANPIASSLGDFEIKSAINICRCGSQTTLLGIDDLDSNSGNNWT